MGIMTPTDANKVSSEAIDAPNNAQSSAAERNFTFALPLYALVHRIRAVILMVSGGAGAQIEASSNERRRDPAL